MFLNELSKDEVICFLNLVSIFARVDNKFAKEEKELVHDYKEELGIVNEEVKTMEYDDIIKFLDNSSERTKGIIYFELVGLALVDGEYENQEVDFLEKIAAEFKISRAKRISIANYFYTFTDIDKFTTVNTQNNIELLKEKANNIL
ncbi:MAG: hypothetical protein E7212_10165 [Clostridium sartagoforme]|nr:hypothetical protein [Clostridium sartagoforme]